MTSAVANANDFNLKSYLFYSVVFHALLTVVVVGASFLERRGDTWGGVGGKLGGTKVNLVTSAGIPMPMESVVKESKAVDPTKGLHKEEPPKPPEPKTDAEKIRKFEKEKPLPPTPKSRTLENKAPVHDNDINYGKGGNPDVSSGYTQNPGASSGVATMGQGGGDFGARYPWYVDAVRNRVRQTWDQTTIDPAVRAAVLTGALPVSIGDLCYNFPAFFDGFENRADIEVAVQRAFYADLDVVEVDEYCDVQTVLRGRDL